MSPKILVERNLRKHAVLDYWESGMDMHRSSNMYASFIEYQRLIQKEFKTMQKHYGFETINGNRSPRAIQNELRARVEVILNGKANPSKRKLMNQTIRKELLAQLQHLRTETKEISRLYVANLQRDIVQIIEFLNESASPPPEEVAHGSPISRR